MNFGTRLETTSHTSDSDMTLVKEFVSGRSEAFDRLYERHSTYVYNTCLSILGDPEDARDAMQETFVQLYRSLPKFRGQSKLSTWIYRIAVNKCMDFVRSRPKWETADCLDWMGTEVDGPSDPALEEQVRQAVLKLKPEYRAVLVLFYFEQLSYSEICEVLNCSMDQVRIRLHRARKAFRKYYEGGADVEM